MANPRVRPHLQFLPENSGSRRHAAWQSDRWLHEMHPGMLTPMVRHLGHDYYIHEVALLKNGQFCVPIRWFTHAGKTWGCGWVLCKHRNDVNNLSWIVEKFNEVTFDVDQLEMCAKELQGQEHYFDAPLLQNIRGK
jgi:hypothetical protein